MPAPTSPASARPADRDGSDSRNARAVPNPARQASIRNANLALLYGLILDAPAPLSRAALAAATGVTRATASALADALLEAGLVAEVSPPPATGAGRPAAGLVPAADGPAGLGLEINVDYLAACVVDLTGTVRATVISPGDQRGRAVPEVLADLADLARQAEAEAGLTVAGAAVAVPGLVEAPHGRIRSAPNLVWRDVEIGAELRRALPEAPFEPVVGNEADFAALAEAHGVGSDPDAGEGDRDGAGNGANPPPALTDFLYVSGEIGVGAGVILDRELFRGARGWAGEIGHVTVEPDGAQCRCGARGCLETVAGLEALRRDRPEAAASALGRAAAAAVNLFDLPAVVLGGVYARPEFAALVPGVEKALAEHVVSARWAPVAVHVSRRGTAAAVTGAATAVIRRVHADPAAWMAAR
ncbi:ROK family protein [Catenulispora sp. GP43]|uniref:ROK family protein n=1 Tax=Catenulispora sp. GP43 TaxID=3156263 RepID=UPI00351492A6